ncbi:MAG: DUF4430 domain-containing protein, partial [Dehalococcoidia bacterium]|nr:DUF4430 domain-containing protein [Dehalococcoidia bacterium]
APPDSQTLAASGSTVTVAITRDFGKEVILEKQVAIGAGTSAMEALEQVTTVETNYGGGFVEAIGGLRSNYTGGAARSDWFYSVNGVNARSGALDYQVRPGDVLHFDYHDWTYSISVPATIGAFPEPFLNGYNGNSYATTIVYDAPFKQEAETLRGKMAAMGVKDVSVIPSSAGLAQKQKEATNLIVLGLSDNPLIAEMNHVYKRLGFFAYFQDGKLEVMNAQGKRQAEYQQGAGLLLATQSPWNPSGVGAAENVVWVVSGTDEAGVKLAAQALTERADSFRYAFGAVVTGAGVTKAPQ